MTDDRDPPLSIDEYVLRVVVTDIVTDVVGTAIVTLQAHLDAQLTELHADVDIALEKLDELAIDGRDTRRQEAKREWVKLRRKFDELEKRMAEMEAKKKEGTG